MLKVVELFQSKQPVGRLAGHTAPLMEVVPPLKKDTEIKLMMKHNLGCNNVLNYSEDFISYQGE